MSLVKDGDGELYYKTDAAGGLARSNDIWDDGPVGNVQEIYVCHNDFKICSIQTTYNRQGKSLVSSRHGGKGDVVDIITANGPLTWVSGYYGTIYRCRSIRTIIKTLSFGTGRETYGPFGCKKTDDAVFFSFKSDRAICGFHGSNSDIEAGLCSIGVYYMTIADGCVDQAAMPSPAPVN